MQFALPSSHMYQLLIHIGLVAVPIAIAHFAAS